MHFTEEQKDELQIMNMEWEKKESVQKKELERKMKEERIKEADMKVSKVIEGEERRLAFFLGYIRAIIITETGKTDYKEEENEIFNALKESLIRLLWEERVEEGKVKERMVNAIEKILERKEKSVQTVKKILREM